ncbi:conserved hypothetical protein [Polynucleobacter meluiroseus]|uniref:Porin n=1 Tax=Polynucleobacter meluiroseus TaxID=1938814 RepID=A0A240E1J2_9BURK|nr:conserved hypothetical protein [Polynucleobacter meluiroseus]
MIYYRKTLFGSGPKLTAVQDYRSYGIDQSHGLPALQIELGTVLPNHFYVGMFNSNVTSGAGFPGGSLETDLFVGWFHEVNDYHINAGVYGTIYPGSNVQNYVSSPIYPSITSGMVHNGDVFVAVRKGPITIQENLTFTNFSSYKSPTGATTAGSSYTNITGAFPMSTWTWANGGWSLMAHTGYQFFNHYSAGSYFDWQLGISKQIDRTWSVNLSYIQTNARGNCNVAATSAQPYCYAKYQNANGTGTGSNINAGGPTAVLSITATNF